MKHTQLTEQQFETLCEKLYCRGYRQAMIDEGTANYMNDCLVPESADKRNIDEVIAGYLAFLQEN